MPRKGLFPDFFLFVILDWQQFLSYPFKSLNMYRFFHPMSIQRFIYNNHWTYNYRWIYFLIGLHNVFSSKANLLFWDSYIVQTFNTMLKFKCVETQMSFVYMNVAILVILVNIALDFLWFHSNKLYHSERYFSIIRKRLFPNVCSFKLY